MWMPKKDWCIRNNAAFPIRYPFLSLGHPEAICRGVATTYRYSTEVPTSGVPRGLWSAGALSLSTLLLPFFPLGSDKFRDLHTEKVAAVLNIVLDAVLPNVHIRLRFASSPHLFPEIIFLHQFD